MKSVAIIIHIKKPSAKKVAIELISWLSKRGIEVKMVKSDASAIGRDDLGIKSDVLITNVDLLIALGGDGTILRAVRLLGGKDVPILGVNLGKFGFLAEVDVENLYNVLSQIIEGKYQCDKRMLLRCEVIKDGESVLERDVLNEVVAGRGAQQRLIRFKVDINGKFFANYSSDSVILATPTGSTAYSLSAGGPLISPATKVMVMTPVCPHSFFNRSIVLSKSDEVCIRCIDRHAIPTITFDGITISQRESFDYLKITTSSREVNLIKFGERDFYTVLKEKLEAWTRVGG